MKLSLIFQISLFLLWLLSGVLAQESLSKEDVSVERLKDHLRYLGSDSLRGRAPGSVGIDMAADYIASELKKYGIDLLPELGSYLQSIPMHGSKPLPESDLTIYFRENKHDLSVYEDYLLYKSGAQTYIPNPVPMVFVGYGIIAPEYDYNDYQYVDVDGKIVVFVEGEPHSSDPDYFEGDKSTIYAYPESKQRMAISRGAIGSILLSVTETGTPDIWERRKNEFYFEDITLAYRVTGHLSILLNNNLNSLLFESASYSYKTVLKMLKNNKLNAFPLNCFLSFHGRFKERDFISSNILGKIPGTDPELKDSYILLSAHYDHLGIGSPVKGDSIYNGVMDNAIGVACLLEIGRVLARNTASLRRSVVLIFLTGEEKGLLGSEYYVDHPVLPLYRTSANINIDGLGFIDTFTDVIPVGGALSDLGGLIAQYANDMGLTVSKLPPQFSAEESFNRSDQISFAGAGIPSVIIADGFRYKNLATTEGLARLATWFDTIYHTPFDDLNQPINFDACEQHLQILMKITSRLAAHPGQIHWKSGSPYINVRLRSIAEKR